MCIPSCNFDFEALISLDEVVLFRFFFFDFLADLCLDEVSFNCSSVLLLVMGFVLLLILERTAVVTVGSVGGGGKDTKVDEASEKLDLSNPEGSKASSGNAEDAIPESLFWVDAG